MYNLSAEMTVTYEFSVIDFPPLLDTPRDPAWPFGVYAQHTVLFHFRELLAQRAVVWDNEEVEGVHQIRVAARRCRTALRTFGSIWEAAEVKRFEKYLSSLADAFGVARDLDVMLVYLRGQLETAQGDEAAAYRWLLARNEQLRYEEQPELERVLLQMEQDGFAQALVAYFATTPVDLWTVEVAADG